MTRTGTTFHYLEPRAPPTKGPLDGHGMVRVRRRAQRRGQEAATQIVVRALIAGSEPGLTLQDNIAAFAELGFAPHVADLSAHRDLATTVMGQSIALPVIISPTGVQAVHPMVRWRSHALRPLAAPPWG